MNEQCCRAYIQALERSARAGEAECEAAVARRADIAKQQVTFTFCACLAAFAAFCCCAV